MPRLLLLLGQSPFDPTSGAAQSTRLIAEMLAAEEFEVEALATTACEGDLPEDHAAVLSELDPRMTSASDGPLLRFQHNQVGYSLLPVQPAWKHDWERHIGRTYEAEYARLLNDWSPDMLLTYGGDSTDVARRRRARRAGAVVIFALHNLYYRKHPPQEVDAFLAPTRFLANAYDRCLNAELGVLPPPLDADRVFAESGEHGAVSFVNPEPAKGALLVAELANRLGHQRSEIPLLVVGGRAPAEALAVVGHDVGLNLTRFDNLLQIPPVGNISEVWGASRVVLMPSVVKEAAGRCALEAMLNGVVPLVSDQGGLAEIVGTAGIRLPPPPPLTGRPEPVPKAIADAWWNALTECFDDSAAWAHRSELCKIHAAQFVSPRLAPTYNAWFRARLPHSKSER